MTNQYTWILTVAAVAKHCSFTNAETSSSDENSLLGSCNILIKSLDYYLVPND